MTKTEIQTIRNIIRRLNKPNCGCSLPDNAVKAIAALNTPTDQFDRDIQGVSRLYLNTWVVGALEHLLPESRNPELAKRLSS